MRQILMLVLVVMGTGCHVLDRLRHDCKADEGSASCRRPALGCEPKCEKPKPVSKPAVVKAAPEPAPPIANDVLLVPKTVYIPYAPQTPVSPVRLVGGQVPQPFTAPPQDVGKPAPTVKPPVDEETCKLTRQMLDLCRKLNERLDRVEQQLQRAPAGCAPACPSPPFLRKPLFQRCEPLQQCQPGFEPAPELIAPPTNASPLPKGQPE